MFKHYSEELQPRRVNAKLITSKNTAVRTADTGSTAWVTYYKIRLHDSHGRWGTADLGGSVRTLACTDWWQHLDQDSDRHSRECNPRARCCEPYRQSALRCAAWTSMRGALDIKQSWVLTCSAARTSAPQYHLLFPANKTFFHYKPHFSSNFTFLSLLCGPPPPPSTCITDRLRLQTVLPH
jgi:hypothetical protein